MTLFLSLAIVVLFIMLLHCSHEAKTQRERAERFSRQYADDLEVIASLKEELSHTREQVKTLRKMLSLEGQRFMVIERRNCVSVVRYDEKYPNVHVTMKNFPFKEGNAEDRDFAIFEAEEFLDILTA